MDDPLTEIGLCEERAAPNIHREDSRRAVASRHRLQSSGDALTLTGLLLFLLAKQSNDVVDRILLLLLLLLGVALLTLRSLRLLLLSPECAQNSLNTTARLLSAFAPQQAGQAAG